MLKILRTFALAAAMLLPLATQAQLTYNFEDNAIPTGWTNDATYPWVVTATSQTDASNNTHNGTYCLMSSNAGISSSTSTISATFNFAAGGSISFYGGCWGEGTSTAWDKCIFKIDGVQQFANGALATWDTYTYTVSSGTHVFEWTYSKDGSVNPTGDAFYIDDIVITGGAAATCFNVQNLAVTATTSSSITLSWTDTINSGATYTVYDMSDTTSANATISGNTAVIDNLSANTEYTFGVVTDCGSSDYSSYATVMVRTACGAIATLPYTMGFEADDLQGTTNALRLPWCWSRYASGTGSYTYYPYSNTSYVHEGSRALYFYCGTGASYPDTQAVVLPELDVNSYPMSANRVTFWARMSSASYSNLLQVGTMTDPTDISTFVMVDTVRVSGNTHTKYSVPLTTATGAYVALVSTRNATANGYMTLDDLTLEEMPACLEVSNVAIVDSLTTSSSITITWEDTQNPDGTTYTVYNMADTSDTYATITGNVAVIENLNAGAQYTFGVQANCAAGNAAYMTVSGYTSCSPVVLPFSENFSASLSSHPCWNGATGTTAAEVMAGTALNLTANSQWVYSSSTSNGLEAGHYRVNIYGTSCKKWMITPALDFSTASSPLLSFDAAFTAYSGTDVATGFESNTSQLFMVLASTDNGQTWDSVANISLASIASTSYLRQYVDLSDYAGDTVRIAFYAQSTVTGGDNNLHVDNISVAELTGDLCFPVTGLSVSGITATAATLTWNGDATAYTVSLIEGTDTAVYVYNDTVAEFYTLQPNTQYTAVIVANCSSDNESDPVSITFRTDCGAEELPFEEDFSASLANDMCWRGATGTTAAEAMAGTALNLTANSQWVYSSSTSNGLEAGHYRVNIYGTSCKKWMITPALDFSTASSPLLSFDAAFTVYSGTGVATGFESNTSQLFMVLASTDNGQTWDSVANISLASIASTEYIRQYVDLSDYAGDTVRIAFYAQSTVTGGDNNLHVDNISVAELTGELCYPIAGLTVDTATATSITLSWSDANNSGATYSIYGADGTVVATGITGTSYTVTDLSPLTGYTFGVVANCSESDASDVSLISATTACAGTTCEINIYAEDSYGDGWNSAVLAVMQAGVMVGSYTMATQGLSNTRIYDTAVVEVCAAAPVSFQWIEGNYDDEIRFMIADANGDSLYYVEDASDLSDGTTFFSMITPCGSAVPDSVTIIFAVNDATMGSIIPAAGTHQYGLGDTVVLIATANDGYHLSGWHIEIPMLSVDTIVDADYPAYTNVVTAVMHGSIFTAMFAADPIVVPEATIAASEVIYWVGEGSNSAVIAVNWADTALAWGVRFSDSITSQEALTLIMRHDLRFGYTLDDNGYLGNITFVDEDGTYMEGEASYFWESKLNTVSDWGLRQTLHNGDFQKWCNSAAGVVVDSMEYNGVVYYMYNYPMTIHAVSVPSIDPEHITITFAVNDATMGSINPNGVQTYAMGDVFTVTAIAFDGYRLKGWRLQQGDVDTTLTGENIPTTMTDTVTILHDGAILTALFEQVQGIDAVDGIAAEVYSTDSRIIVKGAKDMDVCVYDVNGRAVRRQAQASETVVFTMSNSGVYLVKVGNLPAQRVVVVR